MRKRPRPNRRLYKALQGDIAQVQFPVIPREVQEQIDTLTKQRDDALGQLSNRANAEKIFALVDQSLTALRDALDKLEALEDRLAKRILQIARGLGDEE